MTQPQADNSLNNVTETDVNTFALGLLTAPQDQATRVLAMVFSRLTSDEFAAVKAFIQREVTLSADARNRIAGILSQEVKSSAPSDPRGLFSDDATLGLDSVDRVTSFVTKSCDLTLPLERLSHIHGLHGRQGHAYTSLEGDGRFRIYTSLEMGIEGTVSQEPTTGEWFAQIREIQFADHNRTHREALILAQPIFQDAVGSFTGVVNGYVGQTEKTFNVRIENGRIITEESREPRK